MKQLGPRIGPPRHPLAPQVLIKGFLTHRATALLRGLGRGAAPSARALLLLAKMGLDCRRHQGAYPSLPSLPAGLGAVEPRPRTWPLGLCVRGWKAEYVMIWHPVDT